MIIQDDLKLIATKLASLSTQQLQIPVYTKDITENIPRPSFHVAQTSNNILMTNRGTELRMSDSYTITFFGDRKYISAINMQPVLFELLLPRISGEQYTVYPENVQFKNYVDDGILEMTFDVQHIHTIGAGTDESAVEKMQQLLYQENINERTEG